VLLIYTHTHTDLPFHSWYLKPNRKGWIIHLQSVQVIDAPANSTQQHAHKDYDGTTDRLTVFIPLDNVTNQNG
jgi:hypothetical protein